MLHGSDPDRIHPTQPRKAPLASDLQQRSGVFPNRLPERKQTLLRERKAIRLPAHAHQRGIVERKIMQTLKLLFAAAGPMPHVLADKPLGQTRRA